MRVVLIRGRGDTFCAGADLNMLDSRVRRNDQQLGQDRPALGADVRQAFNLSKPTIAVIEGYAVAGGFELMISCDFAIAADEARSATSTSAAHCSAAPGRSTGCRAIIGLRKTKELLFTGKLLTGAECYEWGLANVSAPSGPSSRRRSPTSSRR